MFLKRKNKLRKLNICSRKVQITKCRNTWFLFFLNIPWGVGFHYLVTCFCRELNSSCSLLEPQLSDLFLFKHLAQQNLDMSTHFIVWNTPGILWQAKIRRNQFSTFFNLKVGKSVLSLRGWVKDSLPKPPYPHSAVFIPLHYMHCSLRIFSFPTMSSFQNL